MEGVSAFSKIRSFLNHLEGERMSCPSFRDLYWEGVLDKLPRLPFMVYVGWVQLMVKLGPLANEECG